MTAGHTRSKPSFLWQGVVILLPVVVLAIVSLVSLHQDERTAEADARKRATENVQSLAKAMGPLVDAELRRFLALQDIWTMELISAAQSDVVGTAFPEAILAADVDKWERDYPGFKLADQASPQGEILLDGRQIQPPDFPAVPVPPKWFLELSPGQKMLWESLRLAAPAQFAAYQQAFLDSSPSEEARLAANYLSLSPEQSAGALLPTEAGISFEGIACYRLLSAADARPTPALVKMVCRQATWSPSFVTPKLLEMAAALTNRAGADVRERFILARQCWDGQSRSRDWLVPLRELSRSMNDSNPPSFWVHWAGGSSGDALAFLTPCTFTNGQNGLEGISGTARGYKIAFVPRKLIDAIFERAFNENLFLVPAYAVPRITVEDVTLPSLPGISLPSDKVSLGKAGQKAGNYFAQDAIHFDVEFFLLSRGQMLQAERRRAVMFGALVLGAVLAAFIGWLAARRAFYRQAELNEQKTNFVSSVSHELRAPIASVRLMAENLERGKIPETARQGEYFHFIVQECRRLSSLIENVLDFSRIEQGRKQYDFEPTNLAALTETTVKLMEPYAAEKGVNLKLETSSAPAGTGNLELDIDGRAIQQALVNLIDNAVKHSPKGETVTVGIKKLDGPDAIHLSVSDHGPGIPAAEREKIFERFYRLGSELRRETQGVGIGLSVVKHIVEAHSGRVVVESTPGQGSRFTIELPVKK